MNPIALAAFAAALLPHADPPPMFLQGQVAAISADIEKALKDDPRVRGQRVAIGDFTPVGPNVRKSNFALELKRLFAERLKGSASSDAKLTVKGSYTFATSDSLDNRGKEVFEVTARIVDDRDKELVPFTREVNVTDDIAAAIALTAGIDPKASFAERNDALRKAHANPAFELVDGDRIAAPGQRQWTVRVLRKARGHGAAMPLAPKNVDGRAFVELDLGDHYELELRNGDAHCDVSAAVRIDGLDAANAFAADLDRAGKRVVYSGFHLPTGGQTFAVRGWLHTVKPGAPDSMFAFTLVEHGKGAASAMQHTGELGVITVQFRESVAPGRPLSRSTQAETGKGPPLAQDLKSIERTVGNVLSTVSIRYNIPQR